MEAKIDLSVLTLRAEELAAASDQLTAAIAELDQRLAETRVNVSLWLDERLERGAAFLMPGGAGLASASWQLGYSKTCGSWRLTVRELLTVTTPDGEVETVRLDDGPGPLPLASAPRAVRVAAAPFLPELVRQLEQRAAQYVADVSRALEPAAPAEPLDDGAGARIRARRAAAPAAEAEQEGGQR